MPAPHFAPPDADLYNVLDVSPDAPESQLRARIAALYKEALANTDHRDRATRQGYEELLERLPVCHNVLLDAQKREHYDTYLRLKTSGAESGTFDAYFSRVTGKAALDARNREGLLAIREEQKQPAPTPAPVSQPQPTPSPSIPEPVPAASPTPTAAPFVGLLLGLIVLTVGRGVLHWPLGTSVLAAIIIAPVAGFFLHRQLSSRST